VITGIETEDFDESMKAAALAGSDGYKWGAITGALTGGASELIALNGATSGGLTMNQVAQIQKESKYPLDLIKQFKSMEEFNVFFNEAKLSTGMINGRTAFLPKDTLNSKSFLNFKSKQPDGTEITNLQRMLNGNAPIDPATNKVLQLHHIGQKASSQAVLSARAKAGLSQKELSELTGIDQSDISKIERGAANPSVATLERIAAALGGRLTIAIEPA
jgi:DNA-binding XRE family transcriptional regulator